MKTRLAVSIALLAVLFLAGSAVAQSNGDGDLQAAAQNPVADLISLPFQNNTYFGIGPNDETVNVLNSTLTDLGCEHRTEPDAPELHRLMADVYAALEQEILYLPQ